MALTEDFRESLGACMAFSPRDWAGHHRDAWMYGIVNGWNDEALAELAITHKWPPSEVARLKRLHASFIAAQPGGTP